MITYNAAQSNENGEAMTDQPRGRRPSSGRPLRAGGSQTARTLGLEADTEPSLGDVSFDDWFETPVFESDPDERLEELATSRRGPMRLAASTFLRLNARTSQVRRRTGEAKQSVVRSHPEVATPAAPANGKATTKGRTATTNGRTTNGRTGTATRPLAANRGAGTGTAAPVSGTRPARAARRPAPPAGPTLAPPAPPIPAAADGGGPAGFRQRISEALDRWAEREAAAQTRLERIILPKRWQA